MKLKGEKIDGGTSPDKSHWLTMSFTSSNVILGYEEINPQYNKN